MKIKFMYILVIFVQLNGIAKIKNAKIKNAKIKMLRFWAKIAKISNHRKYRYTVI